MSIDHSPSRMTYADFKERLAELNQTMTPTQRRDVLSRIKSALTGGAAPSPSGLESDAWAEPLVGLLSGELFRHFNSLGFLARTVDYMLNAAKPVLLNLAKMDALFFPEVMDLLPQLVFSDTENKNLEEATAGLQALFAYAARRVAKAHPALGGGSLDLPRGIEDPPEVLRMMVYFQRVHTVIQNKIEDMCDAGKQTEFANFVYPNAFADLLCEDGTLKVVVPAVMPSGASSAAATGGQADESKGDDGTEVSEEARAVSAGASVGGVALPTHTLPLDPGGTGELEDYPAYTQREVMQIMLGVFDQVNRREGQRTQLDTILSQAWWSDRLDSLEELPIFFLTMTGGYDAEVSAALLQHLAPHDADATVLVWLRSWGNTMLIEMGAEAGLSRVQAARLAEAFATACVDQGGVFKAIGERDQLTPDQRCVLIKAVSRLNAFPHEYWPIVASSDSARVFGLEESPKALGTIVRDAFESLSKTNASRLKTIVSTSMAQADKLHHTLESLVNSATLYNQVRDGLLKTSAPNRGAGVAASAGSASDEGHVENASKLAAVFRLYEVWCGATHVSAMLSLHEDESGFLSTLFKRAMGEAQAFGNEIFSVGKKAPYATLLQFMAGVTMSVKPGDRKVVLPLWKGEHSIFAAYKELVKKGDDDPWKALSKVLVDQADKVRETLFSSFAVAELHRLSWFEWDAFFDKLLYGQRISGPLFHLLRGTCETSDGERALALGDLPKLYDSLVDGIAEVVLGVNTLALSAESFPRAHQGALGVIRVLANSQRVSVLLSSLSDDATVPGTKMPAVFDDTIRPRLIARLKRAAIYLVPDDEGVDHRALTRRFAGMGVDTASMGKALGGHVSVIVLQLCSVEQDCLRLLAPVSGAGGRSEASPLQRTLAMRADQLEYAGLDVLAQASFVLRKLFESVWVGGPLNGGCQLDLLMDVTALSDAVADSRADSGAVPLSPEVQVACTVWASARKTLESVFDTLLEAVSNTLHVDVGRQSDLLNEKVDDIVDAGQSVASVDVFSLAYRKLSAKRLDGARWRDHFVASGKAYIASIPADVRMAALSYAQSACRHEDVNKLCDSVQAAVETGAAAVLPALLNGNGAAAPDERSRRDAAALLAAPVVDALSDAGWRYEADELGKGVRRRFVQPKHRACCVTLHGGFGVNVTLGLLVLGAAYMALDHTDAAMLNSLKLIPAVLGIMLVLTVPVYLYRRSKPDAPSQGGLESLKAALNLSERVHGAASALRVAEMRQHLLTCTQAVMPPAGGPTVPLPLSVAHQRSKFGSPVGPALSAAGLRARRRALKAAAAHVDGILKRATVEVAPAST